MAEPSLAKYLYVPFMKPLQKEMFRFQSLLIHISQSPQYGSPPFRFPSWSLHKREMLAFQRLQHVLRVPREETLL
jgi:hypothetical protein